VVNSRKLKNDTGETFKKTYRQSFLDNVSMDAIMMCSRYDNQPHPENSLIQENQGIQTM